MDGCFIVARFTARAGSADVVARLLGGFVGPSRGEDGCLFYDLYRDTADPDRFVIVDGWRDRAAFDAHASSAHVAETLAQLAPHLAAEPDITVLERIAPAGAVNNASEGER